MFNKEGYCALVDTLDKFQIPYIVVKVVPFSADLPPTIPHIEPTNPIMVCGSITLAKIAKQRGWYPGSFMNENHDYRIWLKHYGDHLLNYDSKVCKFSEVDKHWDTLFIRPCEDTKSFNGTVFDYNDFDEWRHRVINLGETYGSLTADTMVSYASPKNISKEFRFFVVDGKIVGQSQYGKRYARALNQNYQALVDDGAIAFAQKMIDIWCPARGFVIDIADLQNDEYKVIEINNLNSSGFYAIDLQKFVMAIENMVL